MECGRGQVEGEDVGYGGAVVASGVGSKNPPSIMARPYTNGHHQPYDLALRERARDLRSRATAAERKLWAAFFRGRQPAWHRQKPLDRFVVDFFCPALRLVVEVDGATHAGADAEAYDDCRTRVLEGLGLRVVRVTNHEVHQHFGAVCDWLDARMAEQHAALPPALSNAGPP